MKKFKKAASLTIALTLAASMTASMACTVVAVGKDASADGSVLVSHTCDGWYDHRIQIVEGGTHAAGEAVDIYRDPCADTKRTPELVGEIPQAPETYTYFNIGYPFMNEKGVVMSEFTWSGRDEVYNGEGLFVIANLEMLGLQRAATAREAVQVMGALAEEYGYCDGGECLLVADQNEVWVFEICGPGMLWTKDSGAPGAHWAARRVPDDQVFTGANRSRLGVLDFNDTENVMWSTGLTDLPEQMGWWKEGEDFNFTELFNPEPYGYPFYAPRREWRVFSLLAPSQTFELKDRYSHYDFTIVPDAKVTKQNIMDIYSDHLEGTEYDATQGLAAGPFHNPTRWGVGKDKPEYAKGQDWERIIAQYRCSYSFVAELRPEMPAAVGTCLWFGEDSPDTTVYVPVYAGVTEVPESWATGDRYHFDPDCAWWAFNFVNNWANLRWDAMYERIRDRKAEFEQTFFDNQAATEAEALKLYETDPAAAQAYLTKYTCDGMNTVEEGWWALAGELVGSFNDGMCIDAEGNNTTLGYPGDWLTEVGFAKAAIADVAELAGEPVPEPEAPEATPAPEATEAPAPEATPEPTKAPEAPATPAPEAPAPESNTGMTVLVAVLAVVVGGAVGFVFGKKKNAK